MTLIETVRAIHSVCGNVFLVNCVECVLLGWIGWEVRKLRRMMETPFEDLFLPTEGESGETPS